MTAIKISQAADPSGAPVQCQTSPPCRILVVEDEPIIRRINAMVLHHAGYHVDTAEDGAFAWEMLGVSCYDLMITDNNMPNLTGMELLKKLYAARMALPFIMATGKMPEEEFTQCPWLQPAAKLLKPYRVEELLGVVKTVLRETNGANTGFQMFRGPDLKDNGILQTEEMASAPVQCQTSPPRRILVVQDEPDIRRLNVEVLESSGYAVDTAEDGMAGWKALHAVFGGVHRIAGTLQHFNVETADVRFILHHENAAGRTCLALNRRAGHLFGLQDSIVLQIRTAKHLETSVGAIGFTQDRFYHSQQLLDPIGLEQFGGGLEPGALGEFLLRHFSRGHDKRQGHARGI